MGDMAEAWRDYKDAKRAERERLHGIRTREILALRDLGYAVRELTDTQFRVNEQIDLYPMRRRWHDITTNTRGRYETPRVIVDRRIGGAR